LWKRAEE